MDPVLDYIHAANQTCLRREQDARRAGPLAKLEDPRVDVCVYFIAYGPVPRVCTCLHLMARTPCEHLPASAVPMCE